MALCLYPGPVASRQRTPFRAASSPSKREQAGAYRPDIHSWLIERSYGHLLGDEGSGYWIGRALVREVLQSDPSSTWPLRDAVLEHFGVASLEDLLPAVYAEPLPSQPDRKLRLASLARLAQAYAFPSGA
jgi:hypothetical protein